MIGLGIDIVDLNNVTDKSNRFYKKLIGYAFSEKERSRFTESLDDPIFIWALWSIKESCYKSSTRAGNRRRFQPNQFEVSFTQRSEDYLTGISILEDQEFNFKTKITRSFICTESYVEEHPYYSEILSSCKSEYYYHSLQVKEGIISRFSNLLKIDSDDVVVSKCADGIPGISLGGKLLDHELSISHDGTKGAFAFSL